MEPGQFEGIVGRGLEESTPWWPPLPSAPAGAPNVVMVLLDDVGYAQFGCYGSDIATPTFDRLAGRRAALQQLPHDRAVLADPRLPADRTQPPRQRHGAHRRVLLRLPRLRRDDPAGATASCPRSSSATATRRSPSASGTSRRRRRWRWARPASAGRSGAGSTASTGSSAGETDQYHPDLVHDNHQVDPPRTPEEGYHLTEDLADRADRLPQGPPGAVRRTGRSSSTSRPAPATRRTRCRARTGIATAAASTRAGTAGARRSSPASRQSGLLPPGTRLSERPAWIAGVGLARRRRAPPVRPDDGGVRRVPRAHRRPGRPGRSTSSTASASSTTPIVLVMSDNGASAEGGPTGSFNENYFFNLVPESLEENLRRIDDLGGPDAHNHYPWGWAWAGNTPLKRWKRETHEGGVTDPLIVQLAGRRRRRRRGPPPVRPRHRRDAHAARRHRHRRRRRRSAASRSDRSTAPASAPRSPTPARRAPRVDPVLRDARLPGDLPRRVEGGHVPPDARVRLRGQRPDARRSTTTSGSCTTSPRTSPRRPTSPPPSPSGCASSIDLWWSEAERNQVLPLNNQPGRHGDRRYRRDRYEYHAGIGVLPAAVAPNLRNRGFRITAELDLPDRRRRRRDRHATAARRAATPCTSRTAGCTGRTTGSAPRSTTISSESDAARRPVHGRA